MNMHTASTFLANEARRNGKGWYDVGSLLNLRCPMNVSLTAVPVPLLHLRWVSRRDGYLTWEGACDG